MNKDNLDKSERDVENWFKLTYDEDPKVRLKAAKKLAEYKDSPVATFAMYELCYDKDDKVKDFAKGTINTWRSEGKEDNSLVPLDDILAEKIVMNVKEPGAVDDVDKRVDKMKNDILSALNGYLNVDKNKRKELADSLTSIIEKLLLDKSDKKRVKELVDDKKRKIKNERELGKSQSKPQMLKNENKEDKTEEEDEEKEKLPDDYITYLEVLSEIEKILPMTIKKKLGRKKLIVARDKNQLRIAKDLLKTDIGSGGREGKGKDENEDENEEDESGVGNVDDLVTRNEARHKIIYRDKPGYNDSLMSDFEGWAYNRAYAVYTSPNVSTVDVKRSIKNIEKTAIRIVRNAINMAKINAQHRTINSLSDLKDGMSKVFTEPLKVILVEEKKIKKNKRNVSCIRLVVEDEEGNEFPVYLWGKRGRGIYENDYIKFENAIVKTYDSTGETVLTVDRKGIVYVVR